MGRQRVSRQGREGENGEEGDRSEGKERLFGVVADAAVGGDDV